MRDSVVRILREEKLLDEPRLEECLALEQESGQTLDRVLLQKGYVSEADILRVFSRALGIPMVANLGDEQVPADFVNRVPVNFARNYGLVAIGRENGTVRVATASPLDTYPLDELAGMMGCGVDPVLAPRTEITNLINKAYKRKADMVDEALDTLGEGDLLGLTADIEVSEDILDVANKAPIIKLDIIVDLRPESPSYLSHVAAELTAGNHRALYVPPRFAHGYQVLEDETETSYQVGEFYAPSAEGGLSYRDPRLGLRWPLPVTEISAKDQSWQLLAEMEPELRRRMTP